MIRKYRHFFLLMILALVVVTCKKLDNFEDYNITNVDAEFGIPLFTTGFTMGDLLENFDDQASLSFGNNGIIVLSYLGDPVVRTSDELFEVLSLVNGIPIPVLDTFTALPFAAPNGIELDSASLKSGGLRFGFSSDHPEDVEVTLTFPSLTKDGIPFQHTLNGSYFGSVPVVGGILEPLDLSGYELTLQNDSVFVRYSALRQSGITDTVANFFILFSNLEASYVEGYLGEDVYELDRDTLEIDLLETLNQAELEFVDPRIHLRVENSFGFPARSQTEVLNIFTDKSGVQQLNSPLVDDGIDFNYPEIDEVGEFKLTEVTFDRSNSNIVDIVNAGPIAVDYKINALTNPDMQTEIRGFLTDTSELRAQLEVELPIYGTIRDFAALDTFRIDTFDFNIDLSEYGDPDFAEFKLVSENSIPLDIDLQLYFAAGNGFIIDSLYASPQVIITAAPVDDQGIVIGSTRKETFSRMDYARFEKLVDAKQLIVTSKFSTLNMGATNVQLLSDQQV
ncbi:MAG: hypothetical protein AAGD05_12950, partial [Bacteroidota bacterium]